MIEMSSMMVIKDLLLYNCKQVSNLYSALTVKLPRTCSVC